jgi:hypothetical protein
LTKQPATDGRTLDGADDGRLVGEQAGRLPIKDSGGVSEPFLGKIAASGIIVPARPEVRTGAEVFPLGSQHDCPAIRIRVRCVERIGDLTDQSVIKKVGRRPLDFHGGHVIGVGHRYVGVFGHGHPPWRPELN